jgi:hypothetical protein
MSVLVCANSCASEVFGYAGVLVVQTIRIAMRNTLFAMSPLLTGELYSWLLATTSIEPIVLNIASQLTCRYCPLKRYNIVGETIAH